MIIKTIRQKKITDKTHHSIIMAFQALIQLIRPLAVRVSIAKALNTAIDPDVSKFALALVRLNALAPHATYHHKHKNDIKQRPNFHV